MSHPRTKALLGLGLLLLAALALTRWPQPEPTAPSHSEHPEAAVAAPAASEVAAGNCKPHGIEMAQCWICDPALRDPGRLWCTEHERYEDRCWLCHPELRDAERLYCEEHGLYEDECAACRPALSADTEEAPGATTQLWCSEHDVAESECGICHPELADALSPGNGLKIRLPGVESASLSGIRSGRPTPIDASTAIETIGELGFDENRLARVTPLVEGVVREVHVDLGDRVRAGERLVTLASPAVADASAGLRTAQAEEDAARRTLQRERELYDRGVSAERDLIDARSALASVRARREALEQKLRDLGIVAPDLEAMARGEGTGSTVELVAPFAGTVVQRSAVVGDVARPGHELVRVADIGEMWVTISVPEHELGRVEVGQPVGIHSTATGADAEGTVSWVSSHLNPATRMASVRAVVPNPEGRWKAGMFVDVRIGVDRPAAALAVPPGAVHRFGGEPFVFIELGDGLYELRRIELLPRGGRGADDVAVVRGGLGGEERIVMASSFLVKSEFQKSRLGAGCVD